jgi:amino acid efflux transporter
VLLTLAAVNAYMTGAAELVAHLRAEGHDGLPARAQAAEEERRPETRGFFAWIAVAGLVELTAEAFGLLDATRMITLTTSLFLVVYVASMASATKVLTGWRRAAAGAACAASLVVLGFAGVSAVLAGLVGVGALVAQTPVRRRSMRAL